MRIIRKNNFSEPWHCRGFLFQKNTKRIFFFSFLSCLAWQLPAQDTIKQNHIRQFVVEHRIGRAGQTEDSNGTAKVAPRITNAIKEKGYKN